MGAPVQGVRIVLTDGQSHSVDSNEMAFKNAAYGAFEQAFPLAGGIILEPIMAVEVEVPSQFQGSVTAALNRRRGVVQDVEAREGGYTVVRADVPLKQMFGYSTDLRSATEGKGEFSMDYKTLQQVSGEDQREIIAAALKRKQDA
jgi:elongation factor G